MTAGDTIMIIREEVRLKDERGYNSVVRCSREKGVLELELEQCREALEKRGMKVSWAKTEYMCLNGMPLGSVHMQYAQPPQVTDFKYLGSTLHSNGDMSTEINKRTQCGWNNWRKMSGVLAMRQKSTTTREGKDTLR